jgi:hypothetical protein
MTKHELEKVLKEILDNLHNGNQVNYSVRLILTDGTIFNGFRLIENFANYIIGLTEEQINTTDAGRAFYTATIVRKGNIDTISHNNMNRGGVELA